MRPAWPPQRSVELHVIISQRGQWVNTRPSSFSHYATFCPETETRPLRVRTDNLVYSQRYYGVSLPEDKPNAWAGYLNGIINSSLATYFVFLTAAEWGVERGLKVTNDRPLTLLVPTVTLRTQKSKRLFYEHAARGVDHAIKLSVQDGFFPEEILDEIALIANVFVHPAASIAMRVFGNNYKAARHAIRKAIEGRPTVDELFAEKTAARHPFRYAP